MARYIDADALMGKYEEFILKNSGKFYITQTAIPLLDILATIETFPTADVVEVVRCRHCKYCSDDTPDGWHWCIEHERWFLEDDDFCSFGVRKGGEG